MQGNSVVLVLEYCCSDLAELIRFAARPLPEALVKGIIHQLLLAVDACHSVGTLASGINTPLMYLILSRHSMLYEATQ